MSLTKSFQLAICVSRYCSVFPPSQLINLVIRKRAGHSGDELPRSHQIMLFWSGLRGAVGVALAAGLEGEHAPALRATVLVVVVLTVIVFGGTTARMLEILGIRTGVEEEMADDDDETEFFHAMDGHEAYTQGKRRSLKRNGTDSGDIFPADVSLSAQHDDWAAVQRAGSQTSNRRNNLTSRNMSNYDSSPVSPVVSPTRSVSSAESTSSDLPPSAYQIPPPARPSTQGNLTVSTPERGTLRSLISATTEDHARWFTQFDETVLKPVLLHDGGAKKDSGNDLESARD